MPDHDKQRQKLMKLLGDLPGKDAPIDCQLICRDENEKFVKESLLLELNGIEPVPAYFIKPRKGGTQFPVIVYNHWHGGEYHLGKEQVLQTINGSICRPWAEELTSLGYAVLAIDHWVFGERRGRSESECFKEMLWQGQVLWGMMVFDSMRAVDYLCSRSDIDRKRIGTLGMSMGSTMAWWLAALDTRIKVCVDICCLTDFDSLIRAKGLDGHGIYYYVPSLLKHFSTLEINRLISPRPHLALAGNFDRLTPLDGLEMLDRELSRIYRDDNAAECWKMVRYNVGHLETQAMRAESVAFLEKFL